MNKTMECKRDRVVDCSAEKVWSWLSDLRNVMTANDFHLMVDLDDETATNPSVGMEVPIQHGVMGWKVYRIARITRFKDYEIAWGERTPDDDDSPDSFPHSEGWRVEPLGPNQCRIHTHLRGRFMTPVGDLVGEAIWNAAMPYSLDWDIQNVALKSGAIDNKFMEEIPPHVDALLRLAQVREIHGVPAADFLYQPFGMKPRH